MSIDFRHARTRPGKVDLVVLGATKEAVASDGVEGVDVSPQFMSGRGFEGGLGQTLVVPGAGRATVVVVGLGPAGDVDSDAVRHASAAVARVATRHVRASIELIGAMPEGIDVAEAAEAIVHGLALASYRYRAYKAEPPRADLETVTIVAPGGKATAGAVARAAAVAEAICWARDLVNEPGGSMTPNQLAKAAKAMARRQKLKVTVMDEAAIRSAKLGGLLGVNRGSELPPRFVRLSYTPDGEPTGRVALVGKGITFDSGGLSIKTGEGMMTMKGDMGGAAAVFAAMSAIAAVGVPVAVDAYVPLTDNMTGGDATRPGDVLTIRGGTTVEVLNTDAEGRLVLADALVLASESAPDAIVDLATLTGACMVALGNRIAGLMGRDDAFLAQVEAAAVRTGERVWRLPLPDDLRPQLDSKVADLKNIAGGRYAGASIAGLFLREFVGDAIPWAHIDIAGPAWSDEERGEVTPGGTGFGVRLLLDLLTNFEASAT
ncbi:MAG: leucyl aminopeptidase [Acidimicrobiia bacterium]|nr:leucyl aminopeptidase [Acidimicrobiia bacterium]